MNIISRFCTSHCSSLEGKVPSRCCCMAWNLLSPVPGRPAPQTTEDWGVHDLNKLKQASKSKSKLNYVEFL